MNEDGKKTVVLGASEDPERYAHKALKRLMENGHPVLPVNPKLTTLEGLPVYRELSEIREPVDTVTVYLSPARSTPLAGQFAALSPKRVILNPGAENPELERALDAAGIPWMHACTLVLLATGRY